jgi:hypothetical protein
MGGIVGGVADAVGSVINPISTIAGSIPVVGPIAGPVAGFITGGPLGAATSIAGQALTGGYSGSGGGGGGGTTSSGTTTPTGPTYGGGSTSTTPYYSPTYNYGANSYTVNNNPFDTSKYFIQGSKGTYNLLPQLADLYGNQSVQQRAGAPSANIYQDILNNIRMNQDTLAEQNFTKNFGLQTYNPNATNPTTLASGFNAPDYLKSDIQNALGEYYPGGTGSGTVPVNYADFGFKSGDTLQSIAQYAKQQKNPFFMPYAPENVIPEVDTRPKPIMPVSSNPQVIEPLRYAPSQDARGPAPRDIVPASVATAGSFRPAENASPVAQVATNQTTPGTFKPVNIRTGGLASLRRS